jgi:hypothetical protein
MRLIAGVPGQALFMYRTADAETVVDNSGYFDDAVDDYNLSTGDVIICVYAFGGTQKVRMYLVTNTSGTITVTDQDGI